jgi:hypothetical protein
MESLSMSDPTFSPLSANFVISHVAEIIAA